MTTENLNEEELLIHIQSIVLNKLEKHWQAHQQPLPLSYLSKRFGRLIKKLGRVGEDVSMFFDSFPDAYHVCHTGSYRCFVFPKAGWDSLDPIQKERWLMI